MPQPENEQADRGERVYLIGSQVNALVKIGRSTNVQRRLADIQRMSPVELDVLWLTVGNADLETRLHRAFRARRTHGEWFNFAGLDAVEAVRGFLTNGSLPEDPNAKPTAPARGGSSFLSMMGQAVRISAPDWPGPPVGVVSSIETRQRGGSLLYWVRDVTDEESGKPQYAFHRPELQLAATARTAHHGTWPMSLQSRAQRRTGLPSGWL